jgi:hypothetical protein
VGFDLPPIALCLSVELELHHANVIGNRPDTSVDPGFVGFRKLGIFQADGRLGNDKGKDAAGAALCEKMFEWSIRGPTRLWGLTLVRLASQAALQGVGADAFPPLELVRDQPSRRMLINQTNHRFVGTGCLLGP